MRIPVLSDVTGMSRRPVLGDHGGGPAGNLSAGHGLRGRRRLDDGWRANVNETESQTLRPPEKNCIKNSRRSSIIPVPLLFDLSIPVNERSSSWNYTSAKWKKIGKLFAFMSTDHFGGPGTSVGRPCVCLCVSVSGTITFEWNLDRVVSPPSARDWRTSNKINVYMAQPTLWSTVNEITC